MRVRVLDRGREPFAGVVVSDGGTVAATDEHGVAELPEPLATPFAWVRVPSRWRPDGPCFVRVGRHPDVAEVVFDLRPDDQPRSFAFLQVTDLHVSSSPEPSRAASPDGLHGYDGDGRLVERPVTEPGHLAEALATLVRRAGSAGMAPAFVVATGDLTDHGRAEEFALLDEALGGARAALGAPGLDIWLLPGNHDHYGHQHEPDPDRDRVADGGAMGTGSTWRYEAHVGPRWWSRTYGGLHVVALDWFSHRLGLDDEAQERWLAADLAAVAPGTPVLVCTHDQMGRGFFDRLRAGAPHVRVVGALTGHWHTSRVVEVDGTLHANTGNATFGSFDWHPAHGRVFRWDGERLYAHTIVSAGADAHTGHTFRATARARVPGAVHLGGPAHAGGLVLVPWSDDDRAGGGVAAFGADGLEAAWVTHLGAPVRAGVVATATTCWAVTVHGALHALDIATGELRWRAQVGDPLTMWVHADPAIAGDLVVAGELRELAAFDAESGTLRWRRDDLGRPENLISLAGVAAAGGCLVTGLPQACGLVGLDPATGGARWADDADGTRFAMAPLVADPDGHDAYVVRVTARVQRVGGADGAVRWTARLGATFAPGRPAIAGDSVVCTTGAGTVHRLARADGAEAWRVQLPGESLVPAGPYRRSGQVVVGGAAIAAGAAYVGAYDGRVHRIALGTGAHDVVADLGEPLSSPLTVVGRQVVAATTGGWLEAVDV